MSPYPIRSGILRTRKMYTKLTSISWIGYTIDLQDNHQLLQNSTDIPVTCYPPIQPFSFNFFLSTFPLEPFPLNS